MASRNLATLALLALVLALSASVSDAQSVARPAPPASLTIEVVRVEQWSPPSTIYQAWYNLTFNDSAQDDGSFEYNLWMLGGDSCTAEPCRIQDDIVGAGLASGAIPGRPGWHFFYVDISESDGASGEWTLYLTANSTQESILSCGVSVNFRVNGSFDQCGPTIEAPPGVGLLVTSIPRANATHNLAANIDSRWYLSQNDPNPTNGSFDYWPSYGPKPNLLTNYSGSTPSVLRDGVLNFTVPTFAAPGTEYPFYAAVMARDPLTHQRSELSCTAYVTGGILHASGACGTFGASLADLAASGPTFPFISVPEYAELLQIEENVVASILAVFVILGLSIMGFAAGGFVVGLVAGSLGFALAASLGLVPVWVTILVFMAALALVVLHFKGASPSGG